MEAKPRTNEAIALTAKKVDMALEDIIKMSKHPKSKPRKQQRVPVRCLFSESVLSTLGIIYC